MPLFCGAVIWGIPCSSWNDVINFTVIFLLDRLWRFCNLGPSFPQPCRLGAPGSSTEVHSKIQRLGFMGKAKHRLALCGSPRQHPSRGCKFDFMRGTCSGPKKLNLYLRLNVIISFSFTLVFFSRFFSAYAISPVHQNHYQYHCSSQHWAWNVWNKTTGVLFGNL